MSKDPSISSISKDTPEKATSEDIGREAVDVGQVDVAAQLAAGGYGETITNEEALRIRYAL